MIWARFKNQVARTASAALTLIELPCEILFLLGPCFFLRDNPIYKVTSPMHSWLYSSIVRNDDRGWNGK